MLSRTIKSHKKEPCVLEKVSEKPKSERVSMEEEFIQEEEIEISDALEQILVFAMQEAQDRLTEDKSFAPFAATLVRDVMYFDSITGETPDEMYEKAETFIAGLDGITGYAFCYDGWMDDEQTDAIIAEGGLPGEKAGVAIGCPYSVNEEGDYAFSEEVLFLGEAPNYAENLSVADDWNPSAQEA